MAYMWDVLFYEFKQGDPDAMPGASETSYGLVGVTRIGRERLAKCSEGTRIGEVLYALGEEVVSAIFDTLGEDVRILC